MATHTIHWCQIALILCLSGTIRNILMHDISKVHPLVAVTVSVLCRIRLRTWYLTHTYALRLISAHEHGWLPVPSRARLRPYTTRVQIAAAWLSVAHTWLHDVNGTACLIVTLLYI